MEWQIVVSIIGTIGSIITIMLLNHNWYKRKEMDWKYTVKRFKLGKQYSLMEKQLPPKGQKTIVESVKGLDFNTIRKGLELLQKDEEPIEGEYEENIIDSIVDFAKDNPEIVGKFINNMGNSGEPGKPSKQSYIGD